MYAMVLLTLGIGIIAVITRFRSVIAGEVKPKAYLLMDGEFSKPVITTTRCFNNQFELPVLFYAAGLACIAMGIPQSGSVLILAWIFVALRLIHALIHITYNHLLHRSIAFWSGFLVLIALWSVVLTSAHGA